MRGSVVQLSISSGGVPKLPVASISITREGIVGDKQNDRKHHGGPERAVCLFSMELIERLQQEGHPISPGSCGDNITVRGINWAEVAPGSRFEFDGGVVLEVASYCAPCSTIRNSFTDLKFKRIKQELHPGESRVYARVMAPGDIARDESFVVSK